MFSEARIQLTKESREHPELVTCLAALREQGFKDWEDQIACIAAYCFIKVEGMYFQDELDKLADILTFKLKEMRMITIDSSANVIAASTPKIILPH